MRIYRAEKNGETFYIPPQKLAEYYADGYSLYAEGALDSSSSSEGPRVLSAQSDDGGEFEIDESNLQSVMDDGIADLVHSS